MDVETKDKKAIQVRFVDPGKNYEKIKDEIDAVFVDVLSKRNLMMLE